MTNVIAFKIEGNRKVSGRDQAGSAAILLFTGIRYVRDSDEAAGESDEAAPSIAEDCMGDEAEIDATGRLQA